MLIEHVVGDVHIIDVFNITKDDELNISLVELESFDSIIKHQTDIITSHGTVDTNLTAMTFKYTPSPYYPVDKIFVQVQYMNGQSITYTIEVSVSETIDMPISVYADGSTSTTTNNADGSTTVTSSDGSSVTTYADGSTLLLNTFNNFTTTVLTTVDGKVVTTSTEEKPDGTKKTTVIEIDEDGNSSTTVTEDAPPLVVDESDGSAVVDVVIEDNKEEEEEVIVYKKFIPMITTDSFAFNKIVLDAHPNSVDVNFWEKEIHNYKVAIIKDTNAIIPIVWGIGTFDFSIIKIDIVNNRMSVSFRDDFIASIKKYYSGITSF